LFEGEGRAILQHKIDPIFDRNSRVLILGTFPSVKSREQQFFYGHPQNRFWRVLAGVFDCAVPTDIAEKKALILNNGLALWDVIAACEIEGSEDASIRAVVPNDLSRIIGSAEICHVVTNGGTADRLYRRHCLPQTGIKAVHLPSTSPANARCSLNELLDAWRVLRTLAAQEKPE
jgi:hypoxanthine-DNA glycosylase